MTRAKQLPLFERLPALTVEDKRLIDAVKAFRESMRNTAGTLIETAQDSIDAMERRAARRNGDVPWRESDLLMRGEVVIRDNRLC